MFTIFEMMLAVVCYGSYFTIETDWRYLPLIIAGMLIGDLGYDASQYRQLKKGA